MGFWQVFHDGGWVMYPLLVFSIATWCVVVEKYVVYWQFKRLSSDLFTQVLGHLQRGESQQAREACLKVGSDLISAPLMAYLHEGAGDKASERAERRARDTQLGLRRYLWVLATIGSSAPFIGLFGTVVGIIRSFQDIATAGKGGFSVVAAGISEALIATASGILVAVVAVIFFNYFQVRLSGLMMTYRNRLEDLRDQMG